MKITWRDFIFLYSLEKKSDNNHIGPTLLDFNIIDVNVIDVKIHNYLKPIWHGHLFKWPSWKRIAPFQNTFTFLLGLSRNQSYRTMYWL